MRVERLSGRDARPVKRSDALWYTSTVEPLTYWMVVMLAGDENVVSETKARCDAAACTGGTSCAGHGALQSMHEVILLLEFAGSFVIRCEQADVCYTSTSRNLMQPLATADPSAAASAQADVVHPEQRTRHCRWSKPRGRRTACRIPERPAAGRRCRSTGW